MELGYLRELVDYWRDTYDWRRAEARLNRHPHFLTEIDGTRVHFMHVRSPGARRAAAGHHPRLARIDRRVPRHHRPALRSACARWRPFRRVPRRLPVDPRLRVLRADQRPRVGPEAGRLGVRAADGGARLRAVRRPGRRLGIDGGVATRRDRCRARRRRPPEHGRGGATARPRLREARRRRARCARVARALPARRVGLREHPGNTKPQTIGYSLDDSPVGLAAWIVEKFRAWSDCDGDVERSFTKDQLLDNVMLYWLTATAHSAARLYYEVQHGGSARPDSLEVPVGVAAFPHEVLRTPRRWAETSLQHRALDRHAPWWALRRVRGTRAAPGGHQGILRAAPLAAMSARGTTTRSVVARACARNVTDGSFEAG